MEVKISTIFKEFIKRHKIFTIISLFNFIILSFIFLISQGIDLIFGKIINSYFGEIINSYIETNSIIGLVNFYKLFLVFGMEGFESYNILNKIIFIGEISIIALINISIILIIGIMYLKEIINEIVDKEYRKVYKIKCYLIYFFVCLILKVIDTLILGIL